MALKAHGFRIIATIAGISLMAAFVLLTGPIDSVKANDGGVYAPSFVSTKDLGHSDNSAIVRKPPADQRFLYDESSLVRGTGDLSIKNFVWDRALDYFAWLKGSGSMNFETLRSIDKKFQMVNFTQKSDLVFEGGLLKSSKTLESPLFYKGTGASVDEWFNLTHLDKSESDLIKSVNRFDNTLAFDSKQAFEGVWDIKDQQGWLLSAQKSEQRYSGSFQTQKKIEFRDLGKK